MTATKKGMKKGAPKFTEFPLSKAFQLLETGPAVLVTTELEGHRNVMTMSWHMLLEFTPLIGVCIGPWDHSYHALKETGECVIAVPTVDLATKVVEIGNSSGRDIDKFKEFGLTPVPAEKVSPPLIAECLAHIECRVEDATLVDKYGMWVLEGVKAWIDRDRKERRTIHHVGDGTFVVDGRTIDLKDKMTKWQQFV